MEKYIGVTFVDVESMTRQKYNDLRGWELPADEDGADEGCWVKDSVSGHVNWYPKRVFKKIYQAVSGMTFGFAVEAAQYGFKIMRYGWNGKGMFVVYQKGYPEGIKCNKQTADAWGMKEGDLFRCEPYLQLQMVNGSHSMWTPSINDVLGRDWIILN